MEDAAGQHNQTGMGPTPAWAPSGTTAPGSQDRRSIVWRTPHLNSPLGDYSSHLQTGGSQSPQVKKKRLAIRRGFSFPRGKCFCTRPVNSPRSRSPKGQLRVQPSGQSVFQRTRIKDLLSLGMCRCQGSSRGETSKVLPSGGAYLLGGKRPNTKPAKRWDNQLAMN